MPCLVPQGWVCSGSLQSLVGTGSSNMQLFTGHAGPRTVLCLTICFLKEENSQAGFHGQQALTHLSLSLPS